MGHFGVTTDSNTTIALNLELSLDLGLDQDVSVAMEVLSPEELSVQLFNEMRAPLHRHLLWLSLTPDQSEDVVQETFLRLFQQLSRPDFERRNLQGWVWRVAHNLGLNLRTRENRKDNARELALGQVTDWLADSSPNPEQMFQMKQREQIVSREMSRLEDRDKQCFHLRAQGLGYRQIAAILGIGRSTVADTMTRVTNALRRSYSHP